MRHLPMIAVAAFAIALAGCASPPPTDRLAVRLDGEWVLVFGPDFLGDGN